MTPVKFLHEKGGEDVFAFFPELIHNDFYTPSGQHVVNYTAYAHIGQHTSCNLAYTSECIEADYSEYSDLLKELIGQGYNDLKVLNQQEIEAHRPPTQGEIKFGEGAIHWLTVDLPHILNRKGDIKKWFIFPKDGLRYYTR